MKKKLLAILVALVMTISLAACGAGEETTLTGMVVSVNGTVISLAEMDTDEMSGQTFAEGERPEMPEGMEGFQGVEDFNPRILKVNSRRIFRENFRKMAASPSGTMEKCLRE